MAIVTAWTKGWQMEEMGMSVSALAWFSFYGCSIMPGFFILWTSKYLSPSRTRIFLPCPLFYLAPVPYWWNSLMPIAFPATWFPSPAYSCILCFSLSSIILWPPCVQPIKSTATDFLDTPLMFSHFLPAWSGPIVHLCGSSFSVHPQCWS